MNPRSYNKLYVHKNREDGKQGILLGYKHNKKEIVLYKDKETYFHIPSFSEPILLIDSDLVRDGAVGGPFPAASDRISKNQENYGNFTPYGSPSTTTDGMWFCSWLYYDPINQQSYWLDRFYNPGKFNYNKAIDELNLSPSYEISDPVFIDKPSQMILEPGVLYKYFHAGEQTYNKLVSFFAGLSSERLLLSLTNWTQQSSVDLSTNAFPVKIQTSGNSATVFSENQTEKTRLFPDSVNFDNIFTTTVYVDYDSKYTPSDEFSLSFWVNSDNWEKNTFANILGNYSSKGEGISFSLEDSTATPIIVIPETYYGHLLFLNEKGEGFLDKNLQDSTANVCPNLFAINSENNVIVCDLSGTGTMYKMDQTGEILATTKNYSEEETMFVFLSPTERLIQMLCGENDQIYVLTISNLYTFNESLLLTKSTPHVFNDTVAAFSYNSETNNIELQLVNEVFDVKFVEQTKWSSKTSDGNLYKNDSSFQTFEDNVTQIAIGPDNNIWVLHGENNVSVVDPTKEADKAIIQYFVVGSPISKLNPTNRKKHISFINQFDRETNTRSYICTIYYSDEKILYYYNLDGSLQNILYINELFNSFIVQRKQQNYQKFLFESNGDFTGYEHKRIFKNSLFFKNEKQLVLRVGLKDLSKSQTTYRLFKHAYSIKNWENQSWYHISLILKNKQFTLYLDGKQILQFLVSGRYKLTYDSQPSLHIGTSLGNKEGFNNEVQYISNIFNGKIADICIYDYAISQESLTFFVKKTIVSENVNWLYSTPSLQYIEQIEQSYKHKLPGFKSSLFNLKLIGTEITDKTTREIVEKEIRTIIENVKPAHADLLKIEWID